MERVSSRFLLNILPVHHPAALELQRVCVSCLVLVCKLTRNKHCKAQLLGPLLSLLIAICLIGTFQIQGSPMETTHPVGGRIGLSKRQMENRIFFSRTFCVSWREYFYMEYFSSVCTKCQSISEPCSEVENLWGYVLKARIASCLFTCLKVSVLMKENIPKYFYIKRPYWFNCFEYQSFFCLSGEILKIRA